jgi:hypothetical protein
VQPEQPFNHTWFSRTLAEKAKTKTDVIPVTAIHNNITGKSLYDFTVMTTSVAGPNSPVQTNPRHGVQTVQMKIMRAL